MRDIGDKVGYGGVVITGAGEVVLLTTITNTPILLIVFGRMDSFGAPLLYAYTIK